MRNDGVTAVNPKIAASGYDTGWVIPCQNPNNGNSLWRNDFLEL